MANKSLTDLVARTATADSDLLHINSGGTDYKEQKIDFLEGALYHKFNTSSLLTSQIDALPLEKTFFGMINSYGHTSETGVPLNASFFVTVYNTDNNGYRYAEITSVGGGVVYTNTKNGTAWVGWTAVPTRAEMNNIGKRTLVAEEMKTTGTTFAYTGISFTLTKVSIVSASLSYTNTNTDTIAICGVNSGASGNFYAQAKNNDVGGITPTRIFAYAILPAGTYYVWAKSRSSGSNEVAVYKYQLEP